VHKARGFRIALVGFRGSERDAAYNDYVEQTIHDHLPQADLRDATLDEIDLIDERDFLVERETYDVVALLNIYRESDGAGLPDIPAFLRVSPLHSQYEWVRRLAASRAAVIYVFAGPGGIDGDWLGQIPHYDRRQLTTTFPDSEIGVALFRRHEEKQ